METGEDIPDDALPEIDDDDGDEADLGMVGLQGHIDAVEGGRVYGWAWNPEQPLDRVEVEIRHKGKSIGTARADRFRQDLVEIGMGDGTHAFAFDLPSTIRDTEAEAVGVYFTESQMPLSRGKGRKISLPDRELNPIDELGGRIDRLEASLQQIFRAMNMYRRGEVDTVAENISQLQESLRADITGLQDAQERLSTRLQVVESGANAARSFIDRFNLEIHDRVTRSELEEVRADFEGRLARRGVFAVLAGAITTVIVAYAILSFLGVSF